MISHKGRFETRTPSEVLNELIPMNTERGDNVTMKIKYNNNRKPNIIFVFNSYVKGNTEVDIIEFLPETPYYVVSEPGEMSYTSDISRGFDTWTEWVTAAVGGFGVEAQAICKAAGLNFSYEVLS